MDSFQSVAQGSALLDGRHTSSHYCVDERSSQGCTAHACDSVDIALDLILAVCKSGTSCSGLDVGGV